MTTSDDPMSLLRSVFRNVRKISLFSREMVVNSNERKSCRRQITLGTLRSEDGDGGENVGEKVNSRSFNLHNDYSKSLTLSNVGEPF